MNSLTLSDLKSGRLFIWGKVTRNETENSIKEPQAIPYFFDVPVLQASCGLGFTAILTDKREVYTIGSKSWYLTEAEHEDIDDNKDTLVHWKELSGKEVIQIACGLHFCAALTKSGDVYTWGIGMFGQLGIKEQVVSVYDEFKVPKPTKIENFSNVIYIACGEECMAAITKDKQLYTWGKNLNGMLGHGDEKDIFEPKRVIGAPKDTSQLDDEDDEDEFDQNLEKEEIIHVSCGQSHMACITSRNEIFTWGNNFLGQLGRILQNTKQDFDTYPHLVELVQVGDLVTEENLKQSDEVDFVQVECLKYNTLALTSDGRLFSCGKGGYDGGGSANPHTLLTLVQSLQGKKVKMLSKSNFSTHTGAIVISNDEDHSKGREELWIWGNGEDQKLGVPSLNNNNEDDFNLEESSLLHPRKFPFHVSRDCFYICCGETHSACILKPHPTDKNPNPNLTLDKFEKGETVNTVSRDNKQSKVEEEYSNDDSDLESNDDDYEKEKAVVVKSENTATATPNVSQQQNTTQVEDKSTSSQLLQVKQPTTQESDDDEPISPLPTNAVQVNIEVDDNKDRDHEISLKNQNSTIASSSSNSIKSSSSSSAPKELHGYLSKKGEKGLVKLWRKRFFKLESNDLIYYEKEGGKEKGRIAVSEILDILPSTTQYGFNISTKKSRVLNH
ncbi:hypothetical protein ABK040_013802 [Willaertia magna]